MVVELYVDIYIVLYPINTPYGVYESMGSLIWKSHTVLISHSYNSQKKSTTPSSS